MSAASFSSPSLQGGRTLPVGIAEALGFMQRKIACPDEVRARIAALRVPADEVCGPRMTTNWRPGPGSGRGGSGHYGGGGGAGGAGGAGSGGTRTWGWNRTGPASDTQRISRPVPGSASEYQPRTPRAAAPRFGNRARQDATTEERMMDRIRDKMNKFSLLTYDTIKGWLSQLLDSGETEFLSGFITLVFEKAANETSFCTLYARLITELRTAFPHLNVELRRIFDEFMSVFADVDVEPAAGTSEYDAFVAMRDRRRGRRGYATFLSEIAKSGIIQRADIIATCTIILDSLIAAKQRDEQQMLCEEYADCLMTIMRDCKPILGADAGGLLPKVCAAKDKAGAKSLSNRARFSLMDITDIYTA